MGFLNSALNASKKVVQKHANAAIQQAKKNVQKQVHQATQQAMQKVQNTQNAVKQTVGNLSTEPNSNSNLNSNEAHRRRKMKEMYNNYTGNFIAGIPIGRNHIIQLNNHFNINPQGSLNQNGPKNPTTTNGMRIEINNQGLSFTNPTVFDLAKNGGKIIFPDNRKIGFTREIQPIEPNCQYVIVKSSSIPMFDGTGSIAKVLEKFKFKECTFPMYRVEYTNSPGTIDYVYQVECTNPPTSSK